jgi:hypothetical protein
MRGKFSMADAAFALEFRDDLALRPSLHLPPRPDALWGAAQEWHPAPLHPPAEPPALPDLAALAEAVEVEEVELVEVDEPFLDAAEQAKVKADESQDKRTKKKGACAARPRQNAIEGALAGVGTYEHARMAGAASFAEAGLAPLHFGGSLSGVGFAASLVAGAAWGLAPSGASGGEVPAEQAAAVAEGFVQHAVGSGGMGPPAMGFAVPPPAPVAEAAIARFAEPMSARLDAAWLTEQRPVAVAFEAVPAVSVPATAPQRDESGPAGGAGAAQATTSHAPVEAVRPVAAADAAAGPSLAERGMPASPPAGSVAGPMIPRAQDGVEAPRPPAAPILPEAVGAARPAQPLDAGGPTTTGLPAKDAGVREPGKAHDSGKALGLASESGDGRGPDVVAAAQPAKAHDGGGGKVVGPPVERDAQGLAFFPEQPGRPEDVGPGKAVGPPTGKDTQGPAFPLAQSGKPDAVGEGKAVGLVAEKGAQGPAFLPLQPGEPDDVGGGKAVGLNGGRNSAQAPDLVGEAQPGQAHGHGKDLDAAPSAGTVPPSPDALPAAHAGQSDGAPWEPFVVGDLPLPASPPLVAESQHEKAGRGGEGKSALAMGADASAGEVTPPGHAAGHRGPPAITPNADAEPVPTGITAALPSEANVKPESAVAGMPLSPAAAPSVPALDAVPWSSRGPEPLAEKAIEGVSNAPPEPPGQAHRHATPASIEAPEQSVRAKTASAEAAPVPAAKGEAVPRENGVADPSISFTVTGLMEGDRPSPAALGRTSEAPAAVPLSDVLATWDASVLDPGPANGRRGEHVADLDPGPPVVAASPDPSWHGGRPFDAGPPPHSSHDLLF